MTKKTPQEMAQALIDRNRKNIDDAAGLMLENILGKYLHEVISAGAEPSRSGLRAWALEQSGKHGAVASWFEAVVHLVDESSSK